jgi:mono/diheme cytochrome c family protein
MSPLNPAPVLAVLVAAVVQSVTAGQDAEALYVQYCSACHGIDGRGGQEGRIPPLAGSPWIKGSPDRMIQVVLRGLMGEITVPSGDGTGSTYDLVMPPLGFSLADDQIAAIAGYVRSSWGNSESPVTAAAVEAQRRAADGDTGIWQASEILGKFPLRSDASRQPDAGR